MSNMYGYSDYHGPQVGESTGDQVVLAEQEESDDDDPLRSGLWMEGDSLAPPCGTSVSTIHKLLSFAEVSSQDVLYDFGCGDGRVCLEALVQNDCAKCVGVEVEQDLVERFQYLISKLPDSLKGRIWAVQADLRVVLDAFLTRKTTSNEESANDASQEGNDNQRPDFRYLPLPTVLVMYLLPEALSELEDDLTNMLRVLPGLRLVCNTWGLPRLKATKSLHIEETGGASTLLHLYTKESLPASGQPAVISSTI